MELNTFCLSLSLVLLACVIGVSIGQKPELTLLNDVSDLTCDSRTLFTCKLQLKPPLNLFWYRDGVKFMDCREAGCTALTPPTFDNYIASVNTSTGKTFYLEIDPIKNDDNGQFSCSDGVESNIITTTIRDLTIEKDDFDSKNLTAEQSTVVYSATSNCVDRASEINFLLKKRKPNTNTFETHAVENTTEIILCTDAENPNCGGNTTNKANFTITIQTDQSGDLYELILEVSYRGVTISLQDIGSYNIPNNNSDITTPKVSTDTQPTSATQPTNTTLLHSTKDTTTETNTDITTIVNSYSEVIEPIIILIVGVVILVVLIIACVMYIVCISVIKPTRRKTATFDNINAGSHSTNM